MLQPGGLLILGTPDYGTVGWRTIEPLYGFFAPGGYKDEHITHYTREGLVALCRDWGFALEGTGLRLSERADPGPQTGPRAAGTRA